MGDESAGWHARLYEPGDEEGIVALYARVFGYERTPEWWRWKIKTLPAAVETTWVAVAEKDGSIIGHYPGIPIQMKLHGETRPTILITDVMTAPEFRRRGILLHMAEEAKRHWRNSGFTAQIGLPNDQWGSRTRTVGWITLFPLTWLRFPLHLGRIVARPGRLPRPLSAPARLLGEAAARVWVRPRVGRLERRASASGVAVEEAHSAGSDFDLLWSSLEWHYANCVVRDARYIRWRFLTALPTPYKVLMSQRGGLPTGYIAYRTAGPRDVANGYIADMFTAPDDADSAHALLGAALTDIWQAGAGMAMVTAVPGSPLHSLLRSAGAMQVKTGFDYDIIPLDPTLNVKSLHNPQSWLASGSDFDVV